jgi:hypothetical protein
MPKNGDLRAHVQAKATGALNVFPTKWDLVVHRVQYPSADDLFFEPLFLAECVAGRKGDSEAEECLGL